MGGNPNSAEIVTVTTGVTIAGFTGGDAGEGLDLDGSFLYAFSILPNTSATGKVRDAVFTSENVPGVTVRNATARSPPGIALNSATPRTTTTWKESSETFATAAAAPTSPWPTSSPAGNTSSS